MAATQSMEIAAAAARLIVDDGMEYGAAKKRAARDLAGRRRGLELPANEAVEDEVRVYIGLFHAESQPAELAALRRVAALWMERLVAFRPYLGGAVWRGTATRRNAIRIDLFCDDSKAAELALLDQRVAYDVGSEAGFKNRTVDVLTVYTPVPEFDEAVPVLLSIHDYDDLRGALRADANGRAWRGDLAALRALAPAA